MSWWARASTHFGESRLWLPFAFAFLLVNLTSIDDGGTNANARFATLRAMADDKTFQIDRYRDWTMDWTRTPDGHYYANKAPGPTLAALPLFWVVDRALYPIQARHLDEQGRRQAPRGIHKIAVATAYQVLPFLLLALLLLPAAYPMGLTPTAQIGTLTALLFGNTAAVLMNSYMGNPFAAVAMLGLAYAYLKESVRGMAFAFGWLVLSEYIAGALLLPFAFLVWGERRRLGLGSLAGQVAVGAALPATLWCWYHYQAFGSVLSLPFQFEASAIVGSVESQPGSIWGGITSLLPNSQWLYELLLGPSRGLLFTQPWILVVVGTSWPIYRALPSPRMQRLFLFSLASLGICLWLNAGFPGWHGGGSPGPRYLALALPLFALFLPPLLDRGPIALRALVWATIAISLALRALVYATWILPPPEPLWPYLLRGIAGPKELAELGVFAGILLASTCLARFLPKSPGAPSPQEAQQP